jgi:hypothetical protein
MFTSYQFSFPITMGTFRIIGFLLLVVSIAAKDDSLVPTAPIANPTPYGTEMLRMSKRASIECSNAESTITERDFEFLAGLFCRNLRNSDGKMDELYEWTYIFKKAEHNFSILFQSGCYDDPNIFSMLAIPCMAELRAIWRKCKIYTYHSGIANFT